MRVLQLCHKPPCPAVDGGTKAMHTITMGLLAAGWEVKVVCLSTPKHPFDADALPPGYAEATGVEARFVDTSLNAVDAFNDLVTADNYNISRFFSPDLDILIERILSRKKFDIIHLESLFMTPYIGTIRRLSKAPIVLRSHNLEHVVQQRIADGERHFIKRPYRRLLAKQLRRYEHAALARVDAVAAITPEDAAHFSKVEPSARVEVVPFGADMPLAAAPWPAGGPVFYHLGSMDWLPNVEGVQWLLREVWPQVVAKHPAARLHLAGNHMPPELLATRSPGVTVEGFVPDATAWMAERHVMVVPLLSAGGMRVKMVEGMALGRPVVSTMRGAEGIAQQEGHGVLLAEDAAGMARRMIALLEAPEEARRIGEVARAQAVERFGSGTTVRFTLPLAKGGNQP